MKIYIDPEFKCHTTNPDSSFQEIETDFFIDKCNAFIEGYRFVPNGESWIREDGTVFDGEMISPWKDYTQLEIAQQQYERTMLAQLKNNQNELNASYQEGINSI